MHILITGGGGYLGAVLAPLLLDRGHQIRIYDRFCFGREALSAIAQHPSCEIMEGDIRRLQEHPGLFAGIDSVVHLASLSNDPTCALDEEMTQDVNVESTLELAKEAAQAGAYRFILGSTCAVYGKGAFELLDEASPANPVSAFGASKRAAETVLLGLRGDHFEPVIARTATMFGVSPRMRFDLAVNQMVATAFGRKRIEVRGGGNQWRPFIHVADAAGAIVLLLEAKASEVSGEIFNIGRDDYNFRIRELAMEIAAQFQNVEVEIAKDDDDLRNFRVQFHKIRERLNFNPQRSLLEGVSDVRRFLEVHEGDPFVPSYFNIQRMRELRATPVDQGGEPIAARFIHLSRATLGREEERAVVEALRSGWLTSGAHIAAFERAFAQEVAAPAAVAVSSCTAALHLCLVELGVGPGDEVITSPITWASTGNTILHMGAKVKFVDVRPDTFNMDPAQLEAAISGQTKVIMPVHVAGHPCEMEAIRAVADKHGIPVVEDAAHALGAAYKSVPIGNVSPFACFSFYAIKNITTMEGGMIALQNPKRAAQLRFLATNGMSTTAWDRYGRSAIARPAQVVAPGFKYLMGNVSAAMGIEQLKKFPAFKSARARIAQMYNAVLADVEEIVVPAVEPDVIHAWHLYIIQFRPELLTRSRDELAYDLRRENIGTGVHFYGLHLHQYYRETFGLRPEDFPTATSVSENILSLPIHPQMTDRHVHEVVAALKKVLAHARKR